MGAAHLDAEALGRPEPSLAISTKNPGAPVTSLIANDALTVRSAEVPAVSGK
ncbi:MAG: hypothetical protein ABW245_06360 [Gaiellaceae bacterium]